jgi:hypothetical protein
VSSGRKGHCSKGRPLGGHFADPRTRKPLTWQAVRADHLPGKRITTVLGLPIWWLKMPQYQLTQDILFIDSQGWSIRVPQGFVFNGLSVPWWLWPICPADHADAFAASAVHDWLCTPLTLSKRSKPVYRCHYKRAAQVFHEAMVANGMYAWGARRNYLAVRHVGPRF